MSWLREHRGPVAGFVAAFLICGTYAVLDQEGAIGATGDSVQRPGCTSSTVACEEAGNKRKAKRHYRDHDWGQRKNPLRHMKRQHHAAYANLKQEYQRNTNRLPAGIEARPFNGMVRGWGCSMALAGGLGASGSWCIFGKATEDKVLKPIRDEEMRVARYCQDHYLAAFIGAKTMENKVMSTVKSSAFRSGSGAVVGCVAAKLVTDIMYGVFG